MKHNTALMKIDGKLLDALDTIQGEVSIEYIEDIIETIKLKQLFRENIDNILKKHNITSYTHAKGRFMDLIIHYINHILIDDIIDEAEYYNVTQLKRLFKIETGDFYKLRHDKIEQIILKQIIKMYEDNQIEKFESIHKSKIQGLFDLSFDQLNEFVTDEVNRALQEGADIAELDAYLKRLNT